MRSTVPSKVVQVQAKLDTAKESRDSFQAQITELKAAIETAKAERVDSASNHRIRSL